MTPTATVKVSLLHRHQIAEGILEFSVSRPSGFSFLPGQFARFFIEGGSREYTMVSGPRDDTLDFCVALADGGRFSSRIQQMEVGEPLAMSGPHGHFVYQSQGRPAVMVATGSGVAPFVSYCRDKARPRALLLHGVRAPERQIYRSLLEGQVGRYLGCIPRAMDAPGCYAGRVTDYLATQLAAGAYDFYLCGRRTMIREATAIIDRRFPESRMFIESYND